MQLIFLILTVLAGVCEGAALLLGYGFSLKGRPSPQWLQRLKFIFFCAFFLCWCLWNLFRNLA